MIRLLGQRQRHRFRHRHRHVCEIEVTKTPAQTDVCNGSTVEYTYKVTNKSDFFTWTGSLSDSVLGSSMTPSPHPGAFEEFTASGTITGAVTNIAPPPVLR